MQMPEPLFFLPPKKLTLLNKQMRNDLTPKECQLLFECGLWKLKK
jgi:hypothetical protein